MQNAGEKSFWRIFLPEEDIQRDRGGDDSPAESLGAAGGLHLDDALILKHHSFATLDMVHDGEDEAHHADHDEGVAHAVEEGRIGAAEERHPLEGGIGHGANHDTQPAEHAGALGHEEAEEEHSQHARAQEALELLDEGEDTTETDDAVEGDDTAETDDTVEGDAATEEDTTTEDEATGEDTADAE